MFFALTKFYLSQFLNLKNPINLWALSFFTIMFIIAYIIDGFVLSKELLVILYWALFFISLQGLGFGVLRQSFPLYQDYWLYSLQKHWGVAILAKILSLFIYFFILMATFLVFMGASDIIDSETLILELCLLAPFSCLYTSSLFVGLEQLMGQRNLGIIGHFLTPFWIAPLVIISGSQKTFLAGSFDVSYLLLDLGLCLLAFCLPFVVEFFLGKNRRVF